MTGPASVPVDVTATRPDHRQQDSALTGVAEAQRSTLADLKVIVRPQPDALRQLLPDGTLPPAAPPAAHPPVPSVVPAAPTSRPPDGV